MPPGVFVLPVVGMSRLSLQMPLLVVLATAGCFPQTTAARFESVFNDTLQLCLDQRQAKGKEAAELLARRQKLESIFDNPEGEDFLQFEFNDQVDDEKASCVQEILTSVRAHEH